MLIVLNKLACSADDDGTMMPLSHPHIDAVIMGLFFKGHVGNNFSEK